MRTLLQTLLHRTDEGIWSEWGR